MDRLLKFMKIISKFNTYIVFVKCTSDWRTHLYLSLKLSFTPIAVVGMWKILLSESKKIREQISGRCYLCYDIFCLADFTSSNSKSVCVRSFRCPRICKRDLFCCFLFGQKYSNCSYELVYCYSKSKLQCYSTVWNHFKSYNSPFPLSAFDSILFYIQLGRILYLKRTRINIFQLRLFFYSLFFLPFPYLSLSFSFFILFFLSLTTSQF